MCTVPHNAMALMVAGRWQSRFWSRLTTTKITGSKSLGKACASAGGKSNFSFGDHETYQRAQISDFTKVSRHSVDNSFNSSKV